MVSPEVVPESEAPFMKHKFGNSENKFYHIKAEKD